MIGFNEYILKSIELLYNKLSSMEL